MAGLRALPRAPHGDVNQLGGDFVIDAARRIVFAHRGTSPADRPPAHVLVDAVREAAATP